MDNQGHVKDGVNESDTNKTHNPTPTEPKKDVFTGTDTTSIDGKVVQPGQELRYELTYTNTTGSKQTVTFTDKIPQYTSFVSADNDGVNDNGTITLTLKLTVTVAPSSTSLVQVMVPPDSCPPSSADTKVVYCGILSVKVTVCLVPVVLV